MDNIKNDQLSKYHVTILFYMDDSFMEHVPPHRAYINELITNGTIDYYAVSMETQRAWIIINAAGNKEVEKYLAKSSLYRYWTVEIDSLFVYDALAYRLPVLQFN